MAFVLYFQVGDYDLQLQMVVNGVEQSGSHILVTGLRHPIDIIPAEKKLIFSYQLPIPYDASTPVMNEVNLYSYLLQSKHLGHRFGSIQVFSIS